MLFAHLLSLLVLAVQPRATALLGLHTAATAAEAAAPKSVIVGPQVTRALAPPDAGDADIAVARQTCSRPVCLQLRLLMLILRYAIFSDLLRRITATTPTFLFHGHTGQLFNRYAYINNSYVFLICL